MLLYLLTFLDFKMNIIFNTEVKRESTVFLSLHESVLTQSELWAFIFRSCVLERLHRCLPECLHEDTLYFGSHLYDLLNSLQWGESGKMLRSSWIISYLWMIEWLFSFISHYWTIFWWLYFTVWPYLLP